MTMDPHAEARALVAAWEMEDLSVDEAQEWLIDHIAEIIAVRDDFAAIIAVRDAANESLRALLYSLAESAMQRLVCWLFGHDFVQITPRIADGPPRPSDDAKCRRCGMVIRG
jgi:hypothetical protein